MRWYLGDLRPYPARRADGSVALSGQQPPRPGKAGWRPTASSIGSGGGAPATAVVTHFMIADRKLFTSASGVLQLFIHDTVVRSRSCL